MKTTKIVIVGAGFAGLSAAAHLVQNGFENVVILEVDQVRILKKISSKIN